MDHLHLPDYTEAQVKELVLLCYGLVFNISEENSKYTSGEESGINANPLFSLLIVKSKSEKIKVDWKMEDNLYEDEYYPYQMSQDEPQLNEDDYHISQEDHILSEDHYQDVKQDENLSTKKRKKIGNKKDKKKVSSIKGKKKKLIKDELLEEGTLLPIDKFEDEEGQFTCHVCGLEFIKREALNYHIKRNHENPQGYKCPKCPRMLKSESGLKYHMNIHDGFTFSCHMCPKVLKSKHGLAYHMNIHNCTQAFLCNDCGKSFVTKQKMQNHVRAKHTMERPYVCDTCGAGFVRSDKLLIHKRRVHTGERPYSCEHCDWKGVDSSDLIHHRKKHMKAMAAAAASPQKPVPLPFTVQQ
jgi:predicted RNA-binding Zn-ribbon protein involved in translation (DUF1610 family)